MKPTAQPATFSFAAFLWHSWRLHPLPLLGFRHLIFRIHMRLYPDAAPGFPVAHKPGGGLTVRLC